MTECLQCGRQFKDKRGLTIHLKGCDGSIASVICSHCNEQFANPYSLSVHQPRCKVFKKKQYDLEIEIKQKTMDKLEETLEKNNQLQLKIVKLECIHLKHQEEINRLNQQINTLQRQNSLLNKENDYLKVLVENIGETEIINKTNDTDDFSISETIESNPLEYVYIIQEREFVKEGRPLYKIGRTRQEPNKRHISYPKDSILFMMLSVPNCQNAERAIKSLFKKKFKQDRSIGVEYFEGNIEEMKKEYMKLLA